jgi:taurine dioxygenase
MLNIKPSNAVLGAEILNVDLSQDLPATTIEAIANALHQHEVIVFPNQHLTPEQHIAFSRRFGALEQHVRQDCCRPGYPELFVVSNVIENGKPIGSQDAGFFWHSDLCYVAQPSRGSLFYAREIPMVDGVARGDTLFSSMTAAYAGLPESVRQQITGKQAINSYIAGYTRDRKSGARKPLTAEQKAKTPDMPHPAVRTHPYNGKPCLFMNEGYTTQIVGLDEATNASVLAMIFEHIKKDEFIYRHQWRSGDFLIWDNCATQHRAVLDYALPARRVMERTTLTGTTPFYH